MIEPILFYLLAVMGIAGALGVALAGSIIRSAVALLFTLISVAGIFALLDAEFLAAAQLIIFVGGVLVLIIFGVLLTARQPHSSSTISQGELLIAVTIASATMTAMTIALVRSQFHREPLATNEYLAERLGQALLGDYLLPFELTSVLLLIVMIGAAYLARGRARDAITGPAA